ncbi:MAG: magnesium/cobalt transporter CorA [Planctomycetota bacterium]
MPEDAAPPRVEVFRYLGPELEVRRVKDASEARAFTLAATASTDSAADSSSPTLWVDVEGIGDAPLIEGFRDAFGLHGLALEDVGNVGQRPKYEDYDGVLFVVARMFVVEEGHVLDEQVAFFVGEDFVITFQEQGGDSFQPVRERLRKGRLALRNGGPGYLFVALLDAIVDGYYPVLEVLSERLEALELRVIHDTSPDLLENVYRVRREILALRRAFWPLREVTMGLLRDPHPRVPEAALHHLRDVGDHVVQAVDVVETYRELAASLVDVHLSMVGQRTNEVMRVLTVITAVFIPLSFLAAVYGMNFDDMPELHWRHGYALFWFLCGAVAVGLLVAFQRLGWLRRPEARTPRHRP